MSKEKTKEEKENKRRWLRLPPEAKAQAVERMTLGTNVCQLSEELGVSRSQLYVWKDRQATGGAKPDGDGGKPTSPQDREIQELRGQLAQTQSALGRKALEVDFFAGALRRLEPPAPCPNASSERVSTTKSRVVSSRKAK